MVDETGTAAAIDGDSSVLDDSAVRDGGLKEPFAEGQPTQEAAPKSQERTPVPAAEDGEAHQPHEDSLRKDEDCREEPLLPCAEPGGQALKPVEEPNLLKEYYDKLASAAQEDAGSTQAKGLASFLNVPAPETGQDSTQVICPLTYDAQCALTFVHSS